LQVDNSVANVQIKSVNACLATDSIVVRRRQTTKHVAVVVATSSNQSIILKRSKYKKTERGQQL